MRNQLLDVVKAVSAYSVVLLHVRFPGRTGEIINVLARYAVPFFFMVSGYYCYNVNGNSLSKLWGKIRHILVLIFLSFPFYILWQCVQRSIDGKDLFSWLGKLTEWKHIKEFLIYNNTSPVKPHLWFLPALLYCYLLFAVVERLRIHKIAYLLMPVLLAGHFWMEEIAVFTENVYKTMEFRNYLYTGFPFFILGHFIHRYEGWLGNNLSGWCLGTGILCGGLLSIGEYFSLGIQELFAGSMILSVSVFLMAVLKGNTEEDRQPDSRSHGTVDNVVDTVESAVGAAHNMAGDVGSLVGNSDSAAGTADNTIDSAGSTAGSVHSKSVFTKKILDFLAEIGSKHTFFIYLFHLAVSNVVKDLAVIFSLRGSAAYGWLRPLLVCVLTTLLAMGISALRSVHFRKNVV